MREAGTRSPTASGWPTPPFRSKGLVVFVPVYCEAMESDALRGWGGLSGRYWSAALRLQDERLAEVHRRLVNTDRGSDGHREAFRQLHIEAHFLLIAVGHILRSLHVYAEVLDDDAVADVRDSFDRRVPWIKDFRDVLEHLDEYTTGGGHLRKRGELKPSEGLLLTFGPSEQPYEVFAQLGSRRLALRTTARATSSLGDALADAWEARFGPERDLVIWGRSA